MPKCALCKKTDDEPVEYGEFMKKSGICVHYYCVLLATNLKQAGADHSGILGFLVRDIRKEMTKCSKRICHYCNKSNATIACHTCKIYFHQICGNENGCVSEFINEFISYCHVHVPFKNHQMLPDMPTDCWICNDQLGQYSPTMTLRAYCCQNGYVHRKCMRIYALSAGYYLRCLWCGKKDFRDDIRRHGVFVPDREARWDNNETARYADIHCGYSRCDAVICICPQGRDCFRKNWKLLVCIACGSSGVHDRCGGEQVVGGIYTCTFCAAVFNKTAIDEEARKNKSYAFDYTLFMSKSYADFDPLPQGSGEKNGSIEANVNDSPVPEKLEPLAEKPDGIDVASIIPQQGLEENKSESKNVTVNEMLLLGDNLEIQGTAKVKINETDKLLKKLTLDASNVEGFQHTDRLIQKMIANIAAEGRELSSDLAIEVVQRMVDYLEVFGDDDC